MFKANTKLGSLSVQIEAEDIKELFKQVTFFGECPTECECGSSKIVPRHRNVQDNDFYELVCQECSRTFPIGQHKTGGTLFANNSKGWKEPYVRPDND